MDSTMTGLRLTLRGLPYREAGRLVHLWCTSPKGGRHEASYPDYVDWKRGNDVFESVAGYQTGLQGSLLLEGDSQPVKLGRVTASFFPTLGASPALGRGFLPEEELAESERVVVLGRELWSQRFAGADGQGRPGERPRVVGGHAEQETREDAALAACAIPARRALRLDPVVALREE